MNRTITNKASISFYSHLDTNQGKLLTLREKATILRTAKNELSVLVTADIESVCMLSKNQFLVKYNYLRPNRISANEWQCAMTDVYTCYSNKFKAVIKLMSFELYNTVIEKYKSTTRFGVKGCVKSITQKKKNTVLSRCLSWLIKKNITSMTELDNLIEWIAVQSTVDIKSLAIIKSYQEIIKRNETRIFNLVVGKRIRIMRKYSKSIEFVSLTYSNFNQFKERLVVKRDWKARYEGSNSDHNAYFMVACIGFDIENNRLAIPIKYSRKYHGAYSRFNKQDIGYNIIFEDDNNRIRFTCCFDKEYTENYNCENITGLDLNTKNNLLVNNLIDIDYDRKKVKRIIKFTNLLKNKEITPKECKRLNHYRLSLEMDTKERISKSAAELIGKGIDHVVLENISSFRKSNIRLSWMEDIKSNHLSSILQLGTIKDWITKIYERKGIQVTIADAAYTSQECSRCHYVDKGNRLTQEQFKCLCCGHEDNADINASLNISNRIGSDVLNKALFNSSNGRFKMKPLKRQSIKSILDELHVKSINSNGTI